MAIAEQSTGAEVQTITRCIRLEIIKPIGEHTWDSIGPHLRDLRYAIARLLNEGTIACLTSDKAPQSAAADGIKQALDELRAYHAKRAKGISRAAEGDEAHKRASSVRLSMLELPSVMVDAMTGQIKARFTKWRKARFVGTERFPSFTSDTIMVRDRGWRLSRDDKGFVLSVKLHGGTGPWIDFAVRADGGNAIAQARRIVSGGADIKLGDCKLVWDDRGRSWSVRLAYTMPKPPVPELDIKRVLSVHRGVRALLTWATSEGTTGVVAAAAGHDIVKFKNQMHKRRQGMRRHMAGSPRHRGRGWWRKFDNYRKLDDVEERFVDAKCKQAAAEIVKTAVREGCGAILLDDWSARQMAAEIARFEGDYAAWLVRRWPFARSRDAVIVAAERFGLHVLSCAAEQESIKCRKCKNIDAAQDRQGKFTCAKCGFTRSTDCVANLNALEAAGYAGVFEKLPDALGQVVALRKTSRERVPGNAREKGSGKGGARKPSGKSREV